MIYDITNESIKENDIIVTENLYIKSIKKDNYIANWLNENLISDIISICKY